MGKTILISELSNEQLADLMIEKFGDVVLQYLPAKYIGGQKHAQNFVEYYYVGNWRNVVQTWVEDVMVDVVLPGYEIGSEDAQDELEGVANAVREKMFEAYC